MLAAASGDGAGSWLVSGGMQNGAYVQTTEMRRVDGNWENGPDLTSALHDHCQLQLGGKVFIVGGRGVGSTPSSDTFFLDGNVWTAVSSMEKAREFHSCVEFLGKIYSIGGEDGLGGKLSTVEIYDPDLDKWEPGPVLPTAVSKAQVINYKDTLYLVGGEGNTQVYTLRVGADWQILENVEVDEQDKARVVFPAPVVNTHMLKACSKQ